MKTKFLFYLLFVSIALASCKKASTSTTTTDTSVNTWTFTEGSKVFNGVLLTDATLNTLYQGNNSYTFGMLGPENTTGYEFNIVMSLADTTFTTKTYQSGVSGTDLITAFYYSTSIGGSDIYKSSDYSPGSVMNYTIVSYDPVKAILVMSFAGNATDASGNMVAITNGKVTCHIEKV
jgi:hypothetical protein